MKSLLLFFICIAAFSSCLPPRCAKYPQFAQCGVRMVHTHDGMMFRGMPWYKKQNLQYGEQHKGKEEAKQRQSPRQQKREPKRRIVIKMKEKP
jgi:hypothetical protein